MRKISISGILLLVIGFLLFSPAAFAQIPGLPSVAGEAQTSAEEPSLDELIRILENEETRAKLVQSLKAAAYEAPAEGAAAGEAEPVGTEIIRSLPGQIAVYSRTIVEGLLATWERLLVMVDEAGELLAGADSIDLPRIFEAILPVALVAVVVFGVYAASRLVRHPVFRSLARRAEGTGPLRKLFLLIVSAVVDALAVLASWAAGYVAAIAFDGGILGINQALFLNGFLFIEMIKVALGAFVAPQYPPLRLTPFSDRQASYWYFWISRLISFLGYTFLFVAPIVQQNSSLAAANAVRFIVAFVSLCLVVFLILKNRGTVRERLKRAKQQGDKSLKARFYAFLGQIWWVIAIVYAVSVFVVWLSSPSQGLAFLFAATLKSIAAMAIGGLVVSILSRGIVRGIPIPDAARERLPLLERRVNSFIPNALTVIRVLAILVVLGVVLEAWGLFDLTGWSRTELGQRFIGGLVGAGLILVLGFALFLGVSSWVEYRLNPNFGKVPTSRERTLLALFRNGFTITLAVILTMLVLSQIGIDIGPLLAGAGVVGLAVGFGAQKLVQDIITGAFIQLENAMNEGDVVELSGVSGVVEKLTIRSVALRALDGTYHLIPFSSVDRVANMTKDFSQFVADIAVAYRENTEEVKALMREAFDILRAGDQGPNIIDEFEMFGVNALSDSAVVVRGRIKTLPGKQWGVGRVYNEIVKRLFEERGVEIPFPSMTIWFGEDKRGNAPPVHLAAPEGKPLIERETS